MQQELVVLLLVNQAAERMEAVGIVAQDGPDLIEGIGAGRRVDDILDRAVERGVSG